MASPICIFGEWGKSIKSHNRNTHSVVIFAGGTDSSGGAGLPADIKTSAAMGAYGCPVVTAVTVQQTGEVKSWIPVEPDIVREQLQAVHDDGPVAAVKTGMLCNPETADVIATFMVDKLKSIPLIVDPVLKAGAGEALHSGELLDAVREHLIPIATLVTPNIPEAELLADIPVHNVNDMEKVGQIICEMGAEAVLVKGGHLQTGKNTVTDVLVSGNEVTHFPRKRIDIDNVHGTGCSFAAACTSLLAAGYPMDKSVELAGSFTYRVIRGSFRRKSGFLPAHFPLTVQSIGNEDTTSYYLPPSFCSKCGCRLSRERESGEHLFCLNCGFIHYRNPLPAVALLVHDDERILITRRAFPPHRGRLCLPGGFLEIAETVEECGERELFEETGLTLLESSVFSVQTDLTAYGGILLIALEVTKWTGTLRAGDDAEEVSWVPIDEVPSLAFKAHNSLLAKLLQEKKTERKV